MADSEPTHSKQGTRSGGVLLIVGVIVAGLLLVALSGFYLYAAKPGVDRSVTQRQLAEMQRQLNDAQTRLNEATAGPPPTSTEAPPTSTGTNVTVALPRSIGVTIAVPPNMIPPSPDPGPPLGTWTAAAVSILGAIATVLGAVAVVIRALRGQPD
jgi:hypothetical protein